MTRTGPDLGKFSSPSTLTLARQAPRRRKTTPLKRGNNGSLLLAMSASVSVGDRAHDGRDGLFETVAVGLDDACVRGGAKRGGLPGRIDRVSTAQLIEDLIGFAFVGGLALNGSPAGPLL